MAAPTPTALSRITANLPIGRPDDEQPGRSAPRKRKRLANVHIAENSDPRTLLRWAAFQTASRDYRRSCACGPSAGR